MNLIEPKWFQEKINGEMVDMYSWNNYYSKFFCNYWFDLTPTNRFMKYLKKLNGIHFGSSKDKMKKKLEHEKQEDEQQLVE